ncbi:hypothetical protein C0991_001407, partial [Blastosporella zonata]
AAATRVKKKGTNVVKARKLIEVSSDSSDNKPARKGSKSHPTKTKKHSIEDFDDSDFYEDAKSHPTKTKKRSIEDFDDSDLIPKANKG